MERSLNDPEFQREYEQQQVLSYIMDRLYHEYDLIFCRIATEIAYCLGTPSQPWQGYLPDLVVDSICEFTENGPERRYLLAQILSRVVYSIQSQHNHAWLVDQLGVKAGDRAE